MHHERHFVFEEIDCSLRTDISFREYCYPHHQLQRSTLLDHGIDCIKMFVLDYMHLVLLGFVKGVLKFLKEGPRLCCLPHHHIAGISSELEAYDGKNCLRIQTISQYTWLIVLKNYLSKDLLPILWHSV